MELSQSVYVGHSEGVLYNALMGRSGTFVVVQHVPVNSVPAPGMNQNPIFEKWRNEPGETDQLSNWVGGGVRLPAPLEFWHSVFHVFSHVFPSQL